jgi:plasmid stabilization system protein ParE
MKLRFSAAARRELNEAALWLELEEPGLGIRFLEEVAQAQKLILDHPDAWHPLGRHLRRCHLGRFRYGLIYRLKADVVEIIAVAHDRQKPEYWRDRLK